MPHLRSRPAGAPHVWNPLGGPAGGSVGAVARDSAGNLYASFVAGPARDRAPVGRGLYRSTDNGETWSQAAFRGDIVKILLVEPNGTIRAVIGNNSVIVSPDSIGTSTDNGATWRLEPIDFLYDITQLAGRDGHLYAVRSGGYGATEYAKGWKALAAPATMIRRFAVGRDGSVVGAQFGPSDPLLVSHDFGGSWSRGTLTDIRWTDAGFDGTLYALGERSLHISNDGARTWRARGRAPAAFDEFCADPHAGLLGFGTDGTLYRSVDSGASWSDSHVADVSLSCAVMAPDGSIIVGTNGLGLFRSTADGEWRSVGQGIVNSEIWSLAVAQSGALIAGCQGAIHRSTDRGVTWNAARAEFPVDTLFGTRTDPAVTGLLADRNDMLATCNAWILLSMDGGTSWSPLPGGGKFTAMGELVRSGRGTPFTWNESDGIISIDGDGPALRAAGTNGTRVRTLGGSAERSTVPAVNPDQVRIIPIRRLSAGSGGLFALDTSGAIFRTTDNGGSWKKLPSQDGITPRGIAATPDGSLLMAGSCGDLHRFSTDGTDWERLGDLPAGATRLFPFKNGPLLAIVNGRVYRSLDGGMRWLDFDDGIDGEEITDIAIGPEGDLYAASDGSGVFHCAASEVTAPSSGADATGWSALNVRSEPDSARFIVEYNLPSRAAALIALYDAAGTDEIATINELALPGGSNRHVVPFGKLEAGEYIVRLTVGCGAPVERKLTIPQRH